MQSLKAGTLSETEIMELPSRMQTEHIADIFDPEYRLEERSEWEQYDMLYSSGDTVLEGHAFSGDEKKGFVLLYVDGDLLVRGSLVIEDDPESFLVVTGDLVVEGSLLLAGFAEVQGNTRVAGALLGDYNHGYARFCGDVSAGLFVENDDYALDIDGERAFKRTAVAADIAAADIAAAIRAGAPAGEVTGD